MLVEHMNGRYLYRFTHCTGVHVVTRARDAIWRQSWSEALIDYERWCEAGEPDGSL